MKGMREGLPHACSSRRPPVHYCRMRRRPCPRKGGVGSTRRAKMGEENMETVMPLHAAPFWWWRAAWRGVSHVSPLPGAGSLVVKLAQLSLMRRWCSERVWDTPLRDVLYLLAGRPSARVLLVEYLAVLMKILSCRCRWATVGPSSRWTEAPLFPVHRQ